MEKRVSDKNYFNKEIVEVMIFDGKLKVLESSRTMNEYISPYFLSHFILEEYVEDISSGAEKINNDIYPGYFIIKARLKPAT